MRSIRVMGGPSAHPTGMPGCPRCRIQLGYHLVFGERAGRMGNSWHPCTRWHGHPRASLSSRTVGFTTLKWSQRGPPADYVPVPHLPQEIWDWSSS